MGFPAKVKEDALVACGRHCCLCHRFCGLKMEIHHIKPRAEDGPDTLENAIPLCFDCHADMRSYDSKHPKGTKYSEAELRRHRDAWFQKVSESSGVPSGNVVAETDKVMFSRLVEALPWSGSLSFISTNNFAGFSFRTDDLNDLYNFQNLAENPAFEFIDTDLESSKSNLKGCIDRFVRLIGQKTFPTNNFGFNHVPPEWEIENPKMFFETVEEIHQSANDVCSTYRDLVRMGARKLGIVSSMS